MKLTVHYATNLSRSLIVALLAGAAILAPTSTSTAQAVSTPENGPWAGAGLSDPSILTYSQGTRTITTPGTVIENEEIYGTLFIEAPGVVIRNSWIYNEGFWTIWAPAGYVTIEDSLIGHPDHRNERGIGGDNMTVRRVEFEYLEDAIKIGSNSLYEQVYIHNLAAGGPGHQDGIQDDGGAHNSTVRNSYIETLIPGGTSAVIIKSDFGLGHDLLFEGNYMNGGTYTFYSRDGGHGDPYNITVRNNRFGRDYVYGLFSIDGNGTTLEGNVWDDTGAPLDGQDVETVGLHDPATGRWHLSRSDTSIASFDFGNPGDIAFVGDWNCDGVDTPGLFRQSDGFVYLRNSNDSGPANISFYFGNPGDVPLGGDFNGDGCDTVSIYRPSQARFYIMNQLGQNGQGVGPADTTYDFGNLGDQPFIADFDSDGMDTAGLHRQSTGLVYYRNSHSAGSAHGQFVFGDPGDRLVAGDWINAGPSTPALFRPSTATFYFRHSNSQGSADGQFSFGQSSWMPIAGRFGLG
ncbi:MAG: hypothetical protein OEM81_12150 [Acidimicrobiia bacterium]|nr:hypothetical protein [Acidimicrobiia bacterium]